MTARVLIPVGFGFNCEDETAAAFRMVGAEVDLVHLTDLFAGRHARPIPSYQVLAFVGGFSYGDHVASGFVAATRVRAHLQADLSAFLQDGGRVLGICNGFQVLVRLGLLPGPDAGPADFVPRAALANNDRLGYRDAWVTLGADPASTSVWTRGLGRLELPARHGEGKVVLESPEALARLERRGQVAFRYLDPEGKPTEAWPHNPNGSARGVAGITDASGRILGLMPHPDAFLYPWHHPDWPRRKKELEAQEPGGLAIFRAGVAGI
ncbi:MAG TPA: phosphoribosylformylglycinamidine synthase subunit PurQ [Anaeromyxobacteraceae bacterium]|nr:phosphoribosylformylglycinamidine synthase subunit PurQ [Anaeromyxobacteraceae bacterium]